jgi:hypothetical protein
MDQQIIEAAINVITPVMESSIVLAGDYARACGRDFITAMDVQYGMKYAARNITGRYTGTLFPDIDSDEDSDFEDEIEVIDEEDEEYTFTRYEGQDKKFNDMNEAFDTWDQWEPYSPVEKMLKDAVDKNS